MSKFGAYARDTRTPFAMTTFIDGGMFILELLEAERAKRAKS